MQRQVLGDLIASDPASSTRNLSAAATRAQPTRSLRSVVRAAPPRAATKLGVAIGARCRDALLSALPWRASPELRKTTILGFHQRVWTLSMSFRIALSVLAVVLFNSSVAMAAPVLSCEEVDQVGEALSELSIIMNSGADIGQGSEDDQTLRYVVDTLGTIAVAESDMNLAHAADGMDAAWVAMDRDSFVSSTNYAIARMAQISVNECPQ
jgi:hypothetical protein